MNFRVPFGIDSSKGGQLSITLLFSVITFILAVLSVIALHFFNCGEATFSALIFWAVATAFYKMKDIDKLKVTKDSIDIEDDASSNPQTVVSVASLNTNISETGR